MAKTRSLCRRRVELIDADQMSSSAATDIGHFQFVPFYSSIHVHRAVRRMPYHVICTPSPNSNLWYVCNCWWYVAHIHNGCLLAMVAHRTWSTRVEDRVEKNVIIVNGRLTVGRMEVEPKQTEWTTGQIDPSIFRPMNYLLSPANALQSNWLNVKHGERDRRRNYWVRDVFGGTTMTAVEKMSHCYRIIMFSFEWIFITHYLLPLTTRMRRSRHDFILCISLIEKKHFWFLFADREYRKHTPRRWRCRS